MDSLSRESRGGADDPTQIPGEPKRRTRRDGIEFDAVEMAEVGNVDGATIVTGGHR